MSKLGRILPAMLLLSTAAAFCVYNDADKPFNFRIPDGGLIANSGFRERIHGGHKSCCNYADTGCNPSGSKTGKITAGIECNQAVEPGTDEFTLLGGELPNILNKSFASLIVSERFKEAISA